MEKLMALYREKIVVHVLRVGGVSKNKLINLKNNRYRSDFLVEISILAYGRSSNGRATPSATESKNVFQVPIQLTAENEY